jgi:hypothetical protein
VTKKVVSVFVRFFRAPYSIWIGVYTNRNGLDGLFEKWGDENGYKSKYANDSTKKSVNVVANDYVKYPYMDTFKYYYWMVF